MFKQTATRFLKDQKPNLENPGQIARTAATDAATRQTEIFQEMNQKEKDPRRAAMLRMISREIAGSEMTEFLDNL